MGSDSGIDESMRQLSVQYGFVLVATMAMLLLLTLLAVGVAETSLLLTKQTASQWQYWQLRTVASNVNREIADALVKGDNPPCLTGYQIDNQYWSQPVTAWLSTQCHASQMSVSAYSVIEVMPQWFCFAQNTAQSVIFMRVTTQVENKQGAVLHVQSVVAVRVKRSLLASFKLNACRNIHDKISFGIQSWRIA